MFEIILSFIHEIKNLIFIFSKNVIMQASIMKTTNLLELLENFGKIVQV